MDYLGKSILNSREEEGQCACNWFSSDTYGNNQEASDELDRIFGMKNIFTNPKPTALLETISKFGKSQER